MSKMLGTRVILLRTYFDFWKREYPHLKISRPVEDICPYCFAFSNWHRSLASHSYQSSVNDRNDEVDEEAMSEVVTMIDVILVGLDNLAIKDTPVIEARMEVPEAAATPDEEEWDLLLLQIGEHIRMYHYTLRGLRWPSWMPKQGSNFLTANTPLLWTTDKTWSYWYITKSSPG